MGLLKIFQQNLHIYHRNDSTSLCTIHFIYILVLEDVIGSDVGGRFLLAHPVQTRKKLIAYGIWNPRRHLQNTFSGAGES